MSYNHREVHASKIGKSVITQDGELLLPPENWDFLPAGDAPLTKSVKAKGETWIVQERWGKRMVSKGIWASKDNIEAARQEIAEKRASPGYIRRREKDLARRKAKQLAYVDEFYNEIVKYLQFDPRYHNEMARLAEEITLHATPVGSGTVARTSRIPVNKRAEAAVIAWMRHHTTSYDSMHIERVRGRRREVRRNLAKNSLAILQSYRRGDDIDHSCPLKKALEESAQ